MIKILGKMMQDFLNFLIMYCILLVMFAVVGNMNFIKYLDEFQGSFQSVMTIFDASLGNYDLQMYNAVSSPGMRLLG